MCSHFSCFVDILLACYAVAAVQLLLMVLGAAAFKFYASWYVIFVLQKRENRVAAMITVLMVAREGGGWGGQERLKNGDIEINITVKAARTDVNK